jgi:hypothetical protein
MKHIFTGLFLWLTLLKGYSQSDKSGFILSDSAACNGRCLCSPFSTPPFPMADWCGSPLIGEPCNDYPDYLKQAIEKATGKPWTKWNKIGIKIYAWVDASINASSNKSANTPMCYDFIPNKPELDQAIIHLGRDPNTVQTKHFSWGFTIENIYGIDYRYTMAKGYFSDQLIKNNNIYGDDPTQFYGLLYIPGIAEGMLLKVGRFISPADIEAQWAPENYLFSHSLMFSVDPYTFTGLNATIRLSKQIQFELGFHFGNDMSPFCNSAQPNGLAMIRYVAKNNNNSFYGGINSLGAGQYKNGHDDLQMLVAVWGHKFSEKVHTMTETYYIWEYNAALGGTAIFGTAVYGQGGGEGPIIPGLSNAIGAVNFTQIFITSKNYFSIRNGLLDDITGFRTGYATLYTDHTIGFSHNFGKLVMMRPEIRYEQSWKDGITPYDLGVKKNQFSIATDLLIQF